MRKPQSGTPEWHQHKIAVDTVKNPKKGMFLGDPTADEAKKTLKSKFGYTDAEIAKLEESRKSPKKDTVNRLRLKIRSLVESVLKEDGNTVPGNASFTVVEGFKNIKRMMAMLEQAVEGNKNGEVDVTSFWETYDTVMESIRKKLEQIDNTAKRSR